MYIVTRSPTITPFGQTPSPFNFYFPPYDILKYTHGTRTSCDDLILPLLLLPARRRGSAGMSSNSGEVVLLAGVGDAVVAATAGCNGGVTTCELGVTPWSGDNDINC